MQKKCYTEGRPWIGRVPMLKSCNLWLSFFLLKKTSIRSKLTSFFSGLLCFWLILSWWLCGCYLYMYLWCAHSKCSRMLKATCYMGFMGMIRNSGAEGDLYQSIYADRIIHAISMCTSCARMHACWSTVHPMAIQDQCASVAQRLHWQLTFNTVTISCRAQNHKQPKQPTWDQSPTSPAGTVFQVCLRCTTRCLWVGEADANTPWVARCGYGNDRVPRWPRERAETA